MWHRYDVCSQSGGNRIGIRFTNSLRSLSSTAERMVDYPLVQCSTCTDLPIAI
jgi:hypothetical protein